MANILRIMSGMHKEAFELESGEQVYRLLR